MASSQSSSSQTSPPEKPRRLSDSPLLWLLIFGAAGLAALVVIAPKYAKRQARLERMADSRQRLLTDCADAAPATAEEMPRSDNPNPRDGPLPDDAVLQDANESRQPDEAQPPRPLLPLMLLLAALLAIAAVAVGTTRYLRLAEARADVRTRGQVQ